MSPADRRKFLGQLGGTFAGVALAGCGGGGSTNEPPATPAPAPTPPAAAPVPPAPAPAPSAGAMRFDLSSGVGGALVPFCVGFAFRAGDVPSGSGVTADVPNVQVVPKNRWPDGSLKFAIVSGRAPLTAGTWRTIAMSAGSAASGTALGLVQLKATGITARIGCGAYGQCDWSGTDWDTPAATWVSGPEMSSWIYRRAVGADAHLVAWLEVRLFADGAVEVLPWVENGHLNVAAPANRQAVFTFTLGGTQRFSQTIDLPNHCRTPLASGSTATHWLGTDPQLAWHHDTAYLQATHLVPSYRADVASTAGVLTSLVTTLAPLQVANHSPGMGSSGYHPSIGLLPEWDVLYLTSRSGKVLAGVIANACAMGRYGIHFRDETTHRPLRFSQYPNLVVGGGASIGSSGASSVNSYTPAATGTAPPNWASSHHPSAGFLAYLVTGWRYFAEETQFAATLNYLKNNDNGRFFSQGVFQTAAGANTTRGAAWAVRTLAQAACITPDDDPLRAEFTASLQANVDWYHARYVAQANNPQGFVAPYSDYTGTGDNAYFEAAWMQDFFTAAFGYAKALALHTSTAGAQRATEFFAWKARSIIGRLGGTATQDYLFSDAAQYTIAVAPTDAPDFAGGTGPWFANWGQLYAATLGSPNPGTTAPLRGAYYPEASSYWGNLQPALAYAVQHGVAGAAEAYQRMTGASNWQAIADAFNATPVWSVRPASQG